MLSPQSFLQGMQVTIDANSLDCRYVSSVGLDRQYFTAFYRRTVEVDDARTTLPRVASDLCAGQSNLVAEQIYQQNSWLDFGADRLTVHSERGSHEYAFR
jgi:hypothetical protein